MSPKSGQVWKGPGRSPRLVRVIAVVRDQRPYARVENLETGRASNVSLDLMTAHHGWKLVRESLDTLTPESLT